MKSLHTLHIQGDTAPDYLLCDPQEYLQQAFQAIKLFAINDDLETVTLRSAPVGILVDERIEEPTEEVEFTSAEGFDYVPYRGQQRWQFSRLLFERPSQAGDLLVKSVWTEKYSDAECWAEFRVSISEALRASAQQGQHQQTLAQHVVDHALMVAQHHTAHGRPFENLNVNAIAQDAVKTWAGKPVVF